MEVEKRVCRWFFCISVVWVFKKGQVLGGLTAVKVAGRKTVVMGGDDAHAPRCRASLCQRNPFLILWKPRSDFPQVNGWCYF